MASNGKIITFYSYKGGTGRSMALANVAWILAHAGNKVLAIDWDLEAPGLHRYFYPFFIDKDLTDSEGIIDFVNNYTLEAVSSTHNGDSDPEWYKPHADILRYAVSLIGVRSGPGRWYRRHVRSVRGGTVRRNDRGITRGKAQTARSVQ